MDKGKHEGPEPKADPEECSFLNGRLEHDPIYI
jgi:hypothetical protein